MDFLGMARCPKILQFRTSSNALPLLEEMESSSAGTQLDKGYLGRRAPRVQSASGEPGLSEAFSILHHSIP